MQPTKTDPMWQFYTCTGIV